jgi:hypothetical protein
MYKRLRQHYFPPRMRSHDSVVRTFFAIIGVSLVRMNVCLCRQRETLLIKTDIAPFPTRAKHYTEQSNWLQLHGTGVQFQKLIVVQLVKKSHAFYESRRFITVFTRARRQSVSWARLSRSPQLFNTSSTRQSPMVTPRTTRFNIKNSALHSHIAIWWGKFRQKHSYKYVAKWWCLLAMENYMFRPVAAIIRFWHLSCNKSYI